MRKIHRPNFIDTLRNCHQLRLLLKLQLLESPTLFFYILNAGHHRNIYPNILRMALVKRCSVDPELTTNIRNTYDPFNVVDRFNDLAIAELRSLFVGNLIMRNSTSHALGSRGRLPLKVGC